MSSPKTASEIAYQTYDAEIDKVLAFALSRCKKISCGFTTG